jgi:hypothetical protein
MEPDSANSIPVFPAQTSHFSGEFTLTDKILKLLPLEWNETYIHDISVSYLQLIWIQGKAACFV